MEILDDQSLQSLRIEPNGKRAKIAINLFYVIIAIGVLSVIAQFLELELLGRMDNGENYTEEEAQYSDLWMGGIGVVQIIVGVALIVVFLQWFRRAYANLHRLGRKDLEHKDNMAVWFFFIPIMNLFKPLSIMQEIWKSTQIATLELNPDYSKKESNPLIGVWWAFFIISGFAGQIVLKMTRKAETISELIAAGEISLIAEAIDIVSAVVTLLLIRSVSKIESDLEQTMENSKSGLGDLA